MPWNVISGVLCIGSTHFNDRTSIFMIFTPAVNVDYPFLLRFCLATHILINGGRDFKRQFLNT